MGTAGTIDVISVTLSVCVELVMTINLHHYHTHYHGYTLLVLLLAASEHSTPAQLCRQVERALTAQLTLSWPFLHTS